MNKYEKAVAYINDVACGLAQAEISGINGDVVYIVVGLDDPMFRIHEDEVDHLAQEYDLYFANL